MKNIIIKKLISTILLVCFAYTASGIGVYSKPAAKSRPQPQKRTVLKAGIKKNVKKEAPKKKEFQIPLIEDEIVKELDTKNIKKVKYKENVLEDDAAAVLPKEVKKKKHKYRHEIMSDEPVVISSENKKYKRSDYKKQVKTEQGIAVVLKPVNKIVTKNKRVKLGNDEKYKLAYPYIGDRVAFKVVKDVVKDDKVLIEKDTIVYAKIGEVSPRAMGGAPAEMTIEGFEIYDKNGDLIPLDGEVASSGYSLSFWIGLAELATTPFLFGLAVPLLRLLPGGQAVVSPRKNYVVYY